MRTIWLIRCLDCEEVNLFYYGHVQNILTRIEPPLKLVCMHFFSDVVEGNKVLRIGMKAKKNFARSIHATYGS